MTEQNFPDRQIRPVSSEFSTESFALSNEKFMKKLIAKPLTDELEQNAKSRIAALKASLGRPPKLVVVLVGADPASQIYVRNKEKKALALGMLGETKLFSAETTPEVVFQEVQKLNRDPSVDGILVQRPLPKQFNESEVLLWVNPEKDVDAFHPLNAGKLFLGLPCMKPCTPAGIMALLDYYQISVSGKIVCVVGRSSIVGKPIAALLLQANATVIQCHTKTSSLEQMTRQADIVIAAAGKPHLINQSHLKPGAVVIDVGIHKDKTGTTIGDVDFESAAEQASAISPVPGGIGPMTIAILFQNTLWAAEQFGRKL